MLSVPPASSPPQASPSLKPTAVPTPPSLQPADHSANTPLSTPPLPSQSSATDQVISDRTPSHSHAMALTVAIAGLLLLRFILAGIGSQTEVRDSEIASNTSLSSLLNSEESTNLSEQVARVESSAQITPRTTLDPETYTLFSSSELQQLGVVTIPQGATVQLEYKGIKFLRSPQQTFSDDHLFLLQRFIDQTPEALLQPGPAAIVTYVPGEVELGLHSTIGMAAFASGNYIFFNAESFAGGIIGGLSGASSYDDAYQTFEHELVHVYQFNAAADLLARLSPDIITSSGKNWQDYALETPLMTGFAQIGDWNRDESSSKITYTLSNPATKTTEYGKTNIVEDMAETIASVTSGRFFYISPERKSWALNELKISNETALLFQKLPYYEDMLLTSGMIPYNVDYLTSYHQQFKAADDQHFSTEQPQQLQVLVNRYQEELVRRGWSGSLSKKDKQNNVESYVGEFIGPQRNLYLEFTTYDNATGFSQKPTGTILTVVSGYK